MRAGPPHREDVVFGAACLGMLVFGIVLISLGSILPILTVWMTVATVAELLAEKGVKLYIHPSHNVPSDPSSRERLDEALAEYKRRIAGV